MRATCNRCKMPFLRTHRWHHVHRQIKIFGWVLFSWQYREHRDCKHPHMNQANLYAVKRLKGEVPLPFPENEKESYVDPAVQS